MPSLHRHLQLHGPEHDRLAFRADCPICAPRLTGRYPDPRLLSRRGEATVATGLVLAGSLLPVANASADNERPPSPTTPPAVLAEPGDQGESNGDLVGGRGDQGPSTDAGPDSGPAAPQSPEVEVKPPQDPDGRSDPSPSAPSSSAAGSAGSGDSSAQPSGAGSDARSPDSPAADRGPNPSHPTEGGGSRAPSASGSLRSSGDASDPDGPDGQSGGSRRQAASDASSDAGRRVVVEPGDCLWLIAERALGSDANDGQIAATVERIWQRNAHRIGTGNPDLIHPGQTLDLA